MLAILSEQLRKQESICIVLGYIVYCLRSAPVLKLSCSAHALLSIAKGILTISTALFRLIEQASLDIDNITG